MSGSADPRSIPPAAPASVLERLPGLATLRRYERTWLAPDVVGGIVLTAILVPVGMGYAEAAGARADLRAVRDDRRARRLRAPRAESDPGPRARLVARSGHRGHNRAACHRSRQRCHAGGRSGRAVRWPVHRRRRRPCGFRRRPAGNAHPVRLPERDRVDDHRRPAAKAVRLLDRRGGPHRRSRGVRGCAARRSDQPGCAGDRGRLAFVHRGGWACRSQAPGDPRRGRRGDDRVGSGGPCHRRRCPGRGRPTTRPATAIDFIDSIDDIGRRCSPEPSRSPSSRWPTRPCCRAPSQRPVANGPTRRRVDRARCGECRVSCVVGLRGQRERVPHLGRDVVRRSHPVGWARRRRAHRPDARLRAGAACRPALLGTRCRRYRRQPVAGRGRRCGPLVPAASIRVRPVDRMPRGRRAGRRRERDLHRSGSPSSRSSGERGGPTAPSSAGYPG